MERILTLLIHVNSNVRVTTGWINWFGSLRGGYVWWLFLIVFFIFNGRWLVETSHKEWWRTKANDSYGTNALLTCICNVQRRFHATLKLTMLHKSDCRPVASIEYTAHCELLESILRWLLFLYQDSQTRIMQVQKVASSLMMSETELK